ncbi:PREDICTED: disease resistance protein TAO1-like isoform X1 [Camelina sativa]|uniref:ADP-ribosyl cyclase/cyclic ADP-ribose hydrolase n=1 Tax=Camelina sativa TaxID=90675 RepID=A0ABM0T1X1_CAMSA|nr:PREDICTED: disease resistance protein TAO1-like isoform X1 [Camelina sativa]
MGSLFLTTVAAAVGFLTLLRKLRVHQDNQEKKSSSLPPSSPSSLSLSSGPASSSSRNWTYHVFPSFRGEDVRIDFLSHIQMEFQRMGITSFVDNEIKRGESIAPELIRSIGESKIAVVLVSRNYASSKWCLNELVEIMKCREELGQTVMPIFHKVDPTDVKNLTGDFGKVFRRTCAGKTEQDIGRWRQALAEVATIAGYHSTSWDNEAVMIKEIATDISNILINSTPSRDFDGFVGMRAHLEKIEPLLCLQSDEVRMIGIWGPPGIGKTTIARVVYNQLSNSYPLSVFMENIKATYSRPTGSDDYNAKLQLQQQFMSQITNHMDIKIPHLGVAQDRLKDKKVLVVLDGVDKSVQLDAMAKETWWFGPGSRIIITTQDHRLLRAHGINHIYKVDFPATEEALQIFCMYAFGQKFPKTGFEELARKVTYLAGNLPLGLRVMGSYFKGMSKEEWKKSLPRLETSLDADIQSILKFSYDALDDEDKDLFLHIACFFNFEEIKIVEECLAKKFVEVRQRLDVLAEKSLISINHGGCIKMHSLLEKLGREMVRKQSIQGQFLHDRREICEVLTGDAEVSSDIIFLCTGPAPTNIVYLITNHFYLPLYQGSKSVVGINFYFQGTGEEVDISERAFEGMSNLQFLRFSCCRDTFQLSRGLNYFSRRLQILHWSHFPMTCLSFIVSLNFLVTLTMDHSKLEKLWEGIKPLPNLKKMDLSYSVNLKEIPDLSTATSLESLDLRNCSSLIKLTSSIGNVTYLKNIFLRGCSNLLELPTSIGNLINLRYLTLDGCSNLVGLPSTIGNAINLQTLILGGCSSLVELPSSIGNAINLQDLYLHNCSSLVELPSSIGNAINLQTLFLGGCSSLVELPSSIGNAINLQDLYLHNCSSLITLPSSIGNVDNLEILYLYGCSSLVELPSSIGFLINLQKLDLSGCSSLMELPSSIGNAINLRKVDLSDCSDLEELPISIGNLQKLERLRLGGCSKLESLPTNINLESLVELDLTNCWLLKKFPEISTNVRVLRLIGTGIEEVPPSIRSWPHLNELHMPYFEDLKDFPHAFDIIASLGLIDANIQAIPPLIKCLSRLRFLVLTGCRKLVSLPQIQDSVSFINAVNCVSLERLDCSFDHPMKLLNFGNCLKLNKEARELIIQTRGEALLPGGEVPSYFTHRASNGGPLTIKLRDKPIPTSMRFKACIFLVKESEDEANDDEIMVDHLHVTWLTSTHWVYPVLTEHLHTFEFEEKVTSSELVFEFKLENRNDWKIGKCGLRQLVVEVPS